MFYVQTSKKKRIFSENKIIQQIKWFIKLVKEISQQDVA